MRCFHEVHIPSLPRGAFRFDGRQFNHFKGLKQEKLLLGVAVISNNMIFRVLFSLRRIKPWLFNHFAAFETLSS
nr:MAG TPA: hypothetical protein [Caudoviricetes sp.]